MYQKGKRKGVIRFSIRPEKKAQLIQLVGDFNDWQPAEMKKQKDGQFVADVTLPPGAYQYKFVVDGQWTADPDHSVWARNPFGSMNSVAQIE